MLFVQILISFFFFGTGEKKYPLEDISLECLGLNNEKAVDIASQQDPWICDCANRTPITISGNTSALSDFQVKLTVPSTPGINNTYSNILFTDSTKSSVIDHWVQAHNSTEGTVWVEVPDIPISGTTIYMYYNGCGSSGNASEVFDYFNDFDSTTGITDFRNGDFSVETYDGRSVIRKENQCDPNGAEIVLGFNFDDFIFIALGTRPNDGSSNSGCGLDRYGVENSSNNGYSLRRNGHSGNDFGVERRRNGGGGNYVSTSLSPSIPRDTFVITELRRCSSSNTNQAEIFEADGTSIASVTSSISNHNYSNFDRILIHGGHDYLLDYVGLAKNSCSYPSYAFQTNETFSCDRRILVNPFVATRLRGNKRIITN